MKAKQVGDKLTLTWEEEDEIKVGEKITIDLPKESKKGIKIKCKVWDKVNKKIGNSLWLGIEIPSGKLVGLVDGKPVDTDRFEITELVIKK